MSTGSTLKRMVKRSRGFKVASRNDKLQIAYKVLKQMAKGTSDEAILAKATLIVLEE